MHHSMYAVNDSVCFHCSGLNLFDLKQCSQQTDSNFYPLYDNLAAFHLDKSVVKSYFMFGNVNIDLFYK